MSNIWDVTNFALLNWNLAGLWRLALITSILPVLPLVLLHLLPRDKEEQRIMQVSERAIKQTNE